jgi:single-strand DNA-binding protein
MAGESGGYSAGGFSSGPRNGGGAAPGPREDFSADLDDEIPF